MLFILLLLSLVFVTDVVNAETGDAFLADMVETALQKNPELKSFLNNIDLAEENIDLARSGYRPNVNLDAGLSHIQRDTDLSSEWESGTEKNITLSLIQSLYTGGQVSAEIDKENSDAEATKAEYKVLVNDIILDVVTAYMDIYNASESIIVNDNNVQLLQKEFEAVEARFEAGELTKTDVSQSRASLSQSQALLAQAKADYQIALSNLKKVTTKDIELTAIHYPNINQSILPQSLDEALAVSQTRNPNIQAALFQIESEKDNIQQQKGRFYPQVDMNANLSASRDPTFSNLDRQETASFGVSATLPIYQSGIIRNVVRQAKILKSKADDDLEVVRYNVNDRIISEWENYQSILIQISAREAQLDASTLAYKGIQLEEEVGARSILDVLDVNQDVLDARLSLIDAKTNKVKSYYRLLNAIGLIEKPFLG